MSPRSLVLVHAHPDDECLGTGGTIARYSDEGVRVCLVTCTDGEEGEIAPEVGTEEDVRPRLGELRRAELAEACRRLGRMELEMLGYRDSGMAGTGANLRPDAFVNQDLDEAAARIAEVLREVRPQVVVTYDPTGLYGHPDHIRAHQATLRALEEQPVEKVYYTVVPISVLRAARELASALGSDPDDYFTEEDIERVGTDDELVTTSVDCSAYVDQKMSALEAHRSQLGTTRSFFEIPAEIRAMVLGREHYTLASRGGRPLSPAAAKETDLFESL